MEAGANVVGLCPVEMDLVVVSVAATELLLILPSRTPLWVVVSVVSFNLSSSVVIKRSFSSSFRLLLRNRLPRLLFHADPRLVLFVVVVVVVVVV